MEALSHKKQGLSSLLSRHEFHLCLPEISITLSLLPTSQIPDKTLSRGQMEQIFDSFMKGGLKESSLQQKTIINDAISIFTQLGIAER